MGEIDQSDVDQGRRRSRGHAHRPIVHDEQRGGEETEGGLRAEPVDERLEFLEDGGNHVDAIHLTADKEVAHGCRKRQRETSFTLSLGTIARAFYITLAPSPSLIIILNVPP